MNRSDHVPRWTRRTLLTKTAGLGVAATVLATVGTGAPASAWTNTTHAPYRFCGDCFVMFYWGFAPSGHCPATGTTHRQVGWIFKIPFGGGWTPNDQPDWRWCRNCFGLFFSGSWPNQGRCIGTNIENIPHRTGSNIPFNYVLPHDIGEPPGTQANWEFCTNCYQLFFNGYAPQRGVCFAGGGPHVPNPSAFHFAIPVSSY